MLPNLDTTEYTLSSYGAVAYNVIKFLDGVFHGSQPSWMVHDLTIKTVNAFSFFIPTAAVGQVAIYQALCGAASMVCGAVLSSPVVWISILAAYCFIKLSRLSSAVTSVGRYRSTAYLLLVFGYPLGVHMSYVLQPTGLRHETLFTLFTATAVAAGVACKTTPEWAESFSWLLIAELVLGFIGFLYDAIMLSLWIKKSYARWPPLAEKSRKEMSALPGGHAASVQAELAMTASADVLMKWDACES